MLAIKFLERFGIRQHACLVLTPEEEASEWCRGLLAYWQDAEVLNKFPTHAKREFLRSLVTMFAKECTLAELTAR